MIDKKEVLKISKLSRLSIIYGIRRILDKVSLNEKLKGKKDFSKAPPGSPGAELMLPLMLDASSKKKINLKKVIELMCLNPAKRFNIFPRKGIIKKGSDADLCILDLKEKWIVSQLSLIHI